MTATYVRELDACDQIVPRLAIGGSSVVFRRADNADHKQCLRPSIRVSTSRPLINHSQPFRDASYACCRYLFVRTYALLMQELRHGSHRNL